MKAGSSNSLLPAFESVPCSTINQSLSFIEVWMPIGQFISYF